MSLLLPLSLVLPALACGGFYGPTGQIVSSDAQQAIYTLRGEVIVAEYRVRYRGTAQDFAWVIPVPGVVQDVEAGDVDTFDRLESMTAPQIFDQRQGEEEGVGCGCGAQEMSLRGGDALGDTAAAGGGVTVTGAGFAGDYAYVTLRASDGDSLVGWLDENGFDGSSAAEVIAAYTADARGIEWVAAKVRQDAAMPDDDTVFDPIRVTYGAGVDGQLHADFPALMQSTSTTATHHVQIYVLGDGMAGVGGGWTAAPLGDGGVVEVEDDEDVDAYYDVALSDVGGTQRGLARIWSGPYTTEHGGELFLTRFDGIVVPAAETSDVVITDSGEQTWTRTELDLVDQDGDDDRDGDERTAAALLVGLGALRVYGRRR